MKILDISKFFYDIGGAQSSFFVLYNLLIEKGHTVIPFTCSHPANHDTPYKKYFVSAFDEITYGQVNLFDKAKAFFNGIYSFEAAKKLSHLLDDTKPDLANVHNILHQLSPSVFQPLQKRNIPIVQYLHDNHMFCINGCMYINGNICEKCMHHNYRYGLFNRCHHKMFLPSLMGYFQKHIQKMFKLWREKVIQFIVPSQFHSDLMVKWRLKQEKINVIKHFIDKDKYPRFEEEKAEDFILYFGKFNRWKGIMTLLNAAKRLPYKFKMIGKGDLKQTMLCFIKENNLKNVEVLDNLPKEKLFKEIKKSVFTIIPSEWYEVFGRTIIESYIYSKPVIGSNIAAIPESIIDGETGLLFEPGNVEELIDKLKFLMNNLSEVKRMGKNAYDYVSKNHNKEDYYRQLMNVYNKALEG